MKQCLVTICDSIKDRLKSLHDTSGLTFREIAQMSGFLGVPPGTLCAIYKGGEVPRKWRSRLGLGELRLAPVCAKCGQVHVTRRCTNQQGQTRRWVRVMGHEGWRRV